MLNNILNAKNFFCIAVVTAVMFFSGCGGGGGDAGGSGSGGAVVSDSQMTFVINKFGIVQAVAGSSISALGSASVRSVATQKNTVSKITWTVSSTSSNNTILPTFSDAQCVNIAKSLNEASCSTLIVLPDNITPGNFVITGTATGSEGSVRSETFTIQVVNSLASSHIDTLLISNLPLFTGLNQTISIPVSYSFKSGTTVAPEDVSLSWAQTSGPAILFAGQGTKQIAFYPQVAGTYGFSVKLSAIINGMTEMRLANVVVVAAATQTFNLSAGLIQSIAVNQVVTLNGTVSNLAQMGASVNYIWDQVSGPDNVNITNKNSPTASFLPSIPGDYVFKLTANTMNYSQSDTTLVVVLPADPNAFSISAGVAQVINMPNSVVVLNGTFLANPGAVASNPSYYWSQISGAPVTISNTGSLSASFIPQAAGIYQFQLSVTARDLTKSSTTQVTVLGAVDPKSFYVYAGDSQTKNVNTVVNLTGTVTTGVGVAGSPQTYAWTQANNPAMVTLSNANSKTPSFIATTPGDYTFTFATTINGVTQTSQTTVRIQ